VQHLARLAASTEALAMLDLSENSMCAKGISDFLGSLPINAHLGLTSLDLQGNHITDTGAFELAKFFDRLDDSSSLICRCNLSCNLLTSTGITAIASALTRNQTITSLELDNNNFGPTPTGLSAFLKNPCLTELSLRLNALDDGAATALATAVATGGRGILSLNLERNPGITRAGSQQLYEALARRLEQDMLSIAEISRLFF